MNAYLVDDLSITPIQENWLEDIGTTEKHKSIFESIKTPIKTPVKLDQFGDRPLSVTS